MSDSRDTAVQKTVAALSHRVYDVERTEMVEWSQVWGDPAC